ncbi:MAG: arsenite methyltransferase [Bacteroidales bacterium]|nr:arsenite methyltransferase [Bacteroidales bacterium]
MKNKDLKLVVKEKYAKIAEQQILSTQSSCCGVTACCETLEFSMIGDEYQNIKGHNPDADLGLGCGIPTEFAQIKQGDTVVDLGAGAGNDCFVARTLVGENGKIIGLDFTETMVEKARNNNRKMGYGNIEFLLGEIEDMPIPDNTADVVISNCVLNLVPNKEKAFAEIYRILKPNAQLCVSDIVLKGELPEKIKTASEMYVGCVSGAFQIDDYMKIIKNSGFVNIKVEKEKSIQIPDKILLNYLSLRELNEYKKFDNGIYSITVYAEKN